MLGYNCAAYSNVEYSNIFSNKRRAVSQRRDHVEAPTAAARGGAQ